MSDNALPLPTKVCTQAKARVGLLGNPSDMYKGFGLGFTVEELFVTITMTTSPTGSVIFPEDVTILSTCWKFFIDVELRRRGIKEDERPFKIEFTSNIPFQSGLSGSSALLVAALRGWREWFRLESFSDMRIAEIAWRTENEIMSIRAGPLDRLVQAHEGLLSMDFTAPLDPASVEQLDPALLPPLLLVWRRNTTPASSGNVHGPIYERWEKGDEKITAVMSELRSNAMKGKEYLLRKDHKGFCEMVNRNFDLRASIFDIQESDVKLIRLGRALGCATKFPGSGGCVLFVLRDDEHLQSVLVELQNADSDIVTLRPTIRNKT